MVPITTSPSQGKRGLRSSRFQLARPGLPKASVAVCHQVTTLDRAKLTRKIGALSNELLAVMEEALKAAMDLD